MIKKIMAILLVSVVVAGVGTYGTYAYFQEEKIVSDNVNISMGEFEVATYWSSSEGTLKDWTLTNSATEAEKVGSGLSFINVKPGDSFERDIYIVNRGSLDANVTASLVADLGEGINVEITEVNYNQWGPKATVEGNNVSKLCSTKDGTGNHWMRLRVKVTIDEGATEDTINKAFNIESADFINVTAVQTY